MLWKCDVTMDVTRQGFEIDYQKSFRFTVAHTIGQSPTRQRQRAHSTTPYTTHTHGTSACTNERGSQAAHRRQSLLARAICCCRCAQRDELAHARRLSPIGDGILPLTIDTSPPATTGTLESLHPLLGPYRAACGTPQGDVQGTRGCPVRVTHHVTPLTYLGPYHKKI